MPRISPGILKQITGSVHTLLCTTHTIKMIGPAKFGQLSSSSLDLTKFLAPTALCDRVLQANHMLDDSVLYVLSLPTSLCLCWEIEQL